MPTIRGPWTPIVMAAFIVAAAGPVAAQDGMSVEIQRELASLRAELQQLRAEVEALKTLNGRGQVAGVEPAVLTGRAQGSARLEPAVLLAPSAAWAVPSSPAAVQPSVSGPQPSLDLLQTQIAELAQVKVESTSRMPVKVFGTIHTGVFANSATPNWLDAPNIVNPEPADGPGGTFSASLRQTRLGFTVDGPALGPARSSAVVAMDFFGGIPGFQTGQVMGLPRLLVAFARIETDRTALQVGQDHVILAPRDPTSLAAFSFPSLFRSGNLYLRAPHVRVERAMGPWVRATGGILAPIGGDTPGETYRFVAPALNGERSRRPAIQGRLVIGSGLPEAIRHAALGISAHYGWERRGASLADSSAAALDFALRRDRFGAAGELFAGRNIDAFGGALGLDARTAGGWAEAQWFPTQRWTLAAGTGLDEPRGAQRFSLPICRNRSAYGMVLFSPVPEIQAAFEYHWLATQPGVGPERRNHHLDWVLAYRF